MIDLPELIPLQRISIPLDKYNILSKSYEKMKNLNTAEELIELKDKEIARLKSKQEGMEDEIRQLKSVMEDYERCNERLRKSISVGGDGVDWQQEFMTCKAKLWDAHEDLRIECHKWNDAYSELEEKHRLEVEKLKLEFSKEDISMKIDDIKVCVDVVPYPYEKIENLVEENSSLKKNLESTNFLYEAYQDNYELLTEKYDKLLESHANVMEENVCLGIKLLTTEEQHSTCMSNLENFYETMMHPIKLLDVFEELEYGQQHVHVFYKQWYFYPSDFYSRNMPRSAFNTFKWKGNTIHFHSVKNRSKPEDFIGVCGNNIFVHSALTSDVEMCKFLYSRVRKVEDEDTHFIVWEN